MYSKISHKQATLLRDDGKSLKEIASALGIAKSTASYWLTGQANKGAFGTMNRREWLAKIRIRSLEVRRANSVKRELVAVEHAKIRATQLYPTLETKRAILASLYWAEGAKGRKDVVNFANTDPKLIRLFITLFRNCYNPDETKFRIFLHLHPYHDESQSKEFWSDLTSVPLSQFRKTFWKKTPNTGKRYRQNYQGICFLRYNSVTLQREIVAYAHSLGEHLTKNAPVA